MVKPSLREENKWSESGDTLDRVVCRAPKFVTFAANMTIRLPVTS
jgi:hypothetical protein